MKRCVAVFVVVLTIWAPLNVYAHHETPVLLIDGHVHMTNRVFFEGIDPWKAQPIGPFDFERAHQSGVNVVIDNIAPYGYQNYNATVRQVARLIETFHHMMEANADKMELALTSADVRRIVASGKLAVILGIESGFDQDGDVEVLRVWHRLGVRLIQFPGQVTTAFGDSAVRGGAKWGGINDRGRRLIAEMNRLGIIIDITHASEAAQRQIIGASRAPVVASHVALRAICDNPGNMPDDIVRAIAAKGGLIGIHSWAYNVGQRYYDWARVNPAGRAFSQWFRGFLGAADAEPRLVRPREADSAEYIDALDARLTGLWRQRHAQHWEEDPAGKIFVPTVEEWAKHVSHVIELVGPSHVGIGLDLGQGKSSFRDFDAGKYGQLKEALAKRNVPAQVLGENWLRIMDAAKVK